MLRIVVTFAFSRASILQKGTSGTATQGAQKSCWSSLNDAGSLPAADALQGNSGLVSKQFDEWLPEYRHTSAQAPLCLNWDTLEWQGCALDGVTEECSYRSILRAPGHNGQMWVRKRNPSCKPSLLVTKQDTSSYGPFRTIDEAEPGKHCVDHLFCLLWCCGAYSNLRVCECRLCSQWTVQAHS